MELIADILLVAGALGAVFYCFVLARRLARFNDLEGGVGGAVAVLSGQVDELSKTLKAAQGAAGASSASLAQLTERAEGVAKRLELLVASMHDLPEPGVQRPEPPQAGSTHAGPSHAGSPHSAPEEPQRPAQPVFARRAGGR